MTILGLNAETLVAPLMAAYFSLVTVQTVRDPEAPGILRAVYPSWPQSSMASRRSTH